MFKHNKFAGVMLTAALGAGVLLTAPSVHARSTYVSPWQSLYPASLSDDNADCMLCHTTADGRSGLNRYGDDLNDILPGSPSNTELINALMAIEGLDSDSDPTGSSNLVEITASTQPGWNVDDNPTGVVGDLDPSVEEPPVADANGPYSGLVAESVLFDASDSTDPNGNDTIATYAWTFGDGAEVTVTSATVNHAYAIAGLYNVSLVVTDDTGLTGSDSSTANIEDETPGELPPVADANGPYTGTVGDPVLFDASGSTDPNGDDTIASYEWDFGDGTPVITVATATVNHTYTMAGFYVVSLVVTDDSGLTDLASSSANIEDETPGELPPVADANGPYTGTVGDSVLFDASGSTDPNGNDTIASYEWDFGDGTVETFVNATVDHTYVVAGNYNVSLTVTDDTGLTNSDETTASIGEGPLPPTADANGPYSGTVGIPVAFDGSASTDPNDNISSYEWDFGDGTVVTLDSATVDHTYALEGVYDVTLTVIDDTGLSDTDATTANISPTEPEVVDLDIKSFKVTKKVSLTRGKGIISLKLTVENGGVTEGSAPATVTGIQNGALVYQQTLNVTDGVGNGSTRYAFDSFSPDAEGDIEWTIKIADGDPDDDVATATTNVRP